MTDSAARPVFGGLTMSRCSPLNHPYAIEDTITQLRVRHAPCWVGQLVSDAVRDGKQDPRRFRCFSHLVEATADFICVKHRRWVTFTVVRF